MARPRNGDRRGTRFDSLSSFDDRHVAAPFDKLRER